MSTPIREARWRWAQVLFDEPAQNEYDPDEVAVVKFRKSRLDVSRIVLYYPDHDCNRVCVDLDTGEIVTLRGTMHDAQKMIESKMGE